MNPFFNGTEIYKQWMDTVTDTMKPPQSPEQLRREWYKTLKTDELWEVHDEVVRELRSRSIT